MKGVSGNVALLDQYSFEYSFLYIFEYTFFLIFEYTGNKKKYFFYTKSIFGCYMRPTSYGLYRY